MKKKCLIYVVAFNHEKFILKTLKRIPKTLNKKYNIEILVADDHSEDDTTYIAKKFKPGKFKYKIHLHKKNQGYGGNQKIGYFYAIKNSFDYVVLLHGDGQYAPEYLPKILKLLENKNYAAVFGSRMIKKISALKGGMPYYKFAGNIILSIIQNFLLNSKMSEFHSGYRSYKVKYLKKIFFEMNSDDYCFDTEIIIQLILSKFKIKEISIPTFYGDEISYVNGLKYAIQIIVQTIKGKLHNLNLINEKKFQMINNDIANKLKKKYSNIIKKRLRCVKQIKI